MEGITTPATVGGSAADYHRPHEARRRSGRARLPAAAGLILWTCAQLASSHAQGAPVGAIGDSPEELMSWPQYHGVPSHPGFNPFEQTVAPGNVRQLSLAWLGVGETSLLGSVFHPLWEYLTQDTIVNSSPVMVNGTLYVSGTSFGVTPNLYVFQLP